MPYGNVYDQMQESMRSHLVFRVWLSPGLENVRTSLGSSGLFYKCTRRHCFLMHDGKIIKNVYHFYHDDDDDDDDDDDSKVWPRADFHAPFKLQCGGFNAIFSLKSTYPTNSYWFHEFLFKCLILSWL